MYDGVGAGSALPTTIPMSSSSPSTGGGGETGTATASADVKRVTVISIPQRPAYTGGGAAAAGMSLEYRGWGYWLVLMLCGWLVGWGC